MEAGGPTGIFDRLSPVELARINEVLRRETVGGALLVVAAVIALVWANSPAADSYESLRDWTVGPSALHLDLTLGTWAADGLLAIFFFVAGLELKREFVEGELRDPKQAALPVLAAVGGMLLPAAVYFLVNAVADGGDTDGWAIPAATDIAFALAVLAVISTHLPDKLRTFLLTLAVVDDLLAITIIAIFYTDDLDLLMLLLALIPIAAFGLLAQRRIWTPWLLVPLALIAWTLVHESGVHATVAGVLLALTVPVVRSEARGGPGAGPGLAEHLEHTIRPLSAGVAVPVFALLSAGVALGGLDGLGDALSNPVAIGVIAGLVLGKAVGVAGSTWLVARFTRAELGEGLAWPDVIGLSMLAGTGFTVSLLIGELAYPPESANYEDVKIAVLVGSLISIALAAIVLGRRERIYRRRAEGS